MRVSTRNRKPTGLTYTSDIWIKNGGAVLGTDPDPNVTSPAANRILTMPKRQIGVVTGFNRLPSLPFITLGDGVSVSCRFWFKDDDEALWIPIGAAFALPYTSANTGSNAAGYWAGRKWFIQLTAVNGVTKMAFHFR